MLNERKPSGGFPDHTVRAVQDRLQVPGEERVDRKPFQPQDALPVAQQVGIKGAEQVDPAAEKEDVPGEQDLLSVHPAVEAESAARVPGQDQAGKLQPPQPEAFAVPDDLPGGRAGEGEALRVEPGLYVFRHRAVEQGLVPEDARLVRVRHEPRAVLRRKWGTPAAWSACACVTTR